MPKQADQYFADHASSLSERERLGGLCQIYDKWTQSCLRKEGVSEGQIVAETGFGTGSMLKWLSAEVGPKGTVHGYDLTPRFLSKEEVSTENRISTFVHNIQTDPLPNHGYDLVYSRLLLSHLIDTKQAMRNMIDGLKPGGKLIALDYNSLVVEADPQKYPEFLSAVETTNQLIGEEGLLSASYGAEITREMEEIGLINITEHVMARHHKGGDFAAMISAEGIELIGQARPEIAEHCDVIASHMRMSGFSYRDADMHCAIGIKP